MPRCLWYEFIRSGLPGGGGAAARFAAAAAVMASVRSIKLGRLPPPLSGNEPPSESPAD